LFTPSLSLSLSLSLQNSLTIGFSIDDQVQTIKATRDGEALCVRQCKIGALNARTSVVVVVIIVVVVVVVVVVIVEFITQN
jgi:t-SNARE complex subunit (syntaxin)